jgi:hypothetical protein
MLDVDRNEILSMKVYPSEILLQLEFIDEVLIFGKPIFISTM